MAYFSLLYKQNKKHDTAACSNPTPLQNRTLIFRSDVYTVMKIHICSFGLTPFVLPTLRMTMLLLSSFLPCRWRQCFGWTHWLYLQLYSKYGSSTLLCNIGTTLYDVIAVSEVHNSSSLVYTWRWRQWLCYFELLSHTVQGCSTS